MARPRAEAGIECPLRLGLLRVSDGRDRRSRAVGWRRREACGAACCDGRRRDDGSGGRRFGSTEPALCRRWLLERATWFTSLMISALSASDRLDDLEFLEHRIDGFGSGIEHSTGTLLHLGDHPRIDRYELGLGRRSHPE